MRTMAPRKNVKSVIVSEKFRVSTEILIRNFAQDESMSAYEFPSTLTNVERAWVHNYVKDLGFLSKSHGREPTRSLHVSKPGKLVPDSDRIVLSVNRDNVALMRNFVHRFPSRDQSDGASAKQRTKQEVTDVSMGQLTYGVPQLPVFAVANELISFRMKLPIWPLRAQLIQAIVSNQVLVVCGETGSGKTTQIPQFILDYSASCMEKCRIICTQPRRISAVAVAERVAAERGEKSGQTVGFHIRLESCVGPKTVLVYCTNGILLRTLMNGDACLNSLTHIIVDEVHERDRFSDFLLICLRECLVRYPHVRLILMSATVDVHTFTRYFNGAPVLRVPGRQHSVTEYFLEDILQVTGYESPAMVSQRRKQTRTAVPVAPVAGGELQHEMEECIVDCMEYGSDDSFSQLLQLVLSECVPVDVQQPGHGYTALMAAAAHGNRAVCLQLLHLGADVKLRSAGGLRALDFARAHRHDECVHVLQHYETYGERTVEAEDSRWQLDLYHSTVSEQAVDFELLHALLYEIHAGRQPGSVLVFLAGYEDIVAVKERLLADARFHAKPFHVFTLHGHMQMADQHRVFSPLPGKRKIILSTNIAETSITIDDVVFVVDSGKVKEKCFDAVTGVCSLQCAWISQAGAKQRAGRAGRTQPGICYHMFSTYRHSSMQAYAAPEILRMPLQELCLQTKMLAPKGTRIADFLARAIETPSAMAVSSAIEHLQHIDALDEHEQLTFLGQHLVDLPVPPRLGKMLLYSVIFKCVDPLLTIVAFLSYRDPFVLPSVPQQKSVAVHMRKQFALSSFSDHVILLRVFQAWQEARVSKSEKTFCSRYFVSAATMEMVVNIRAQLLALLRASGFVRTRPPCDIRDLNENAHNWALIKAILAAGLYPNVASVHQRSHQIRTKKESKVLLHTSSALRTSERGFSNTEHAHTVSKLPTDWLVYEELSRSGSTYNIRSVTSVTALTVALFVDNRLHGAAEREGSECGDEPVIVLNDWIMLAGDADLIRIVTVFRERINALIRKKIMNPYRVYTGHDEALLHTVCAMLTREDSSAGFQQPPGVGQRPKIMTTSNYQADGNTTAATGRRRQPLARNGTAAAVTDMLYLSRVASNHYNKYIPQDLAAAAEPGNGYQGEMAGITHDLNAMHVYPPLNFGTGFFPPPVEYSDGHGDRPNDFQNNGVTVELEGACGSEPAYTLYYPMPNFVLLHKTGTVDPALEVPRSLMRYNADYTSFYVVKPSAVKAIEVSIASQTWTFSPQLEKKLIRVLETGRIVILIFTVHGSACFQGMARLLSGPSTELSLYSPICTVEWLSRTDVPFDQVKGFLNTAVNDGDELDPHSGFALWALFNGDPEAPTQLDPTEKPYGRPIKKTMRM